MKTSMSVVIQAHGAFKMKWVRGDTGASKWCVWARQGQNVSKKEGWQAAVSTEAAMWCRERRHQGDAGRPRAAGEKRQQKRHRAPLLGPLLPSLWLGQPASFLALGSL